SSRRRHTRSKRDWSSDVCSSDLAFEGPWPAYRTLNVPRWTRAWPSEKFYHVVYSVPPERSEEAARLAMERHAAAVYITERGGPKIGRASCRERVESPGGAGAGEV